jgi:hypothetical protein
VKCAEESNDLSMMKIIESDDFIERAVYHNGCVTNYLLKLKPEKTGKNNYLTCLTALWLNCNSVTKVTQ